MMRMRRAAPAGSRREQTPPPLDTGAPVSPHRSRHDEAASRYPALRAARLLRRGRPGHRCGREGARGPWRAGLCAARDRPQQIRCREPEAERCGLRQGTRRNSGYGRARDLLGPRGAEIRARGGGRRAASSPSTPPVRWSPRSIARREVHHKRGRHIVLIGHAGHPEVVGTMGQLPKGAITLVETLERRRGARARRRPEPGLCDADDAVRRRYARDGGRAQGPVPRTSSGRTRRTSATRPRTARAR